MSFKFYPSAAYSPLYSGLSIWTRWARNNPNRIEILERTNGMVRLRTPDRDLLLASDAHAFNSNRPMNENYDEVAHYSNFHKVNQGLGVDHVMVNYPQHLPKIHQSPRHRRADSPRRDGATVLADSGGFQILTGQIEFLDPAQVAAWYNENTDIGVALDIPIPTSGDAKQDTERLLRSANVQRMNTEMMSQHLDPRVRLMNLIHGHSFDDYQKFRAVVERPDITGDLCISDVYHGTIIQTMRDVLSVMYSGQRYKRYHLLGVYNIPMLLPTIWAAARMREKGLIEHLSSDASTHIQSATVHMMHLQRVPDKPPERMILGIANPNNHASVHRLLPCGCPVCSRVKYADIFGVLPGAISTFLLLMHNQWEIVRYTKMMDEYARTLPIEDYLKLAEGQMTARGAASKSASSSMNAIRMADIAAKSNDPLKDIYNQFKYFMGGSLPLHENRSVFHVMYEPDSDVIEEGSSRASKGAVSTIEDVDVIPEVEVINVPGATDRFDSIMDTYESFHAQKGTVAHGEKAKKKPGGNPMTLGGSMFTKGHQRATAGSGSSRPRIVPITQRPKEDAAAQARRKIKRLENRAVDPSPRKPSK